MEYNREVARVSRVLSALYEFDRRWQMWLADRDNHSPSVVELSVDFCHTFDSWRFAAGKEYARIGKAIGHPGLEAEGAFLKMSATVSNRIDATLYAFYRSTLEKKGSSK